MCELNNSMITYESTGRGSLEESTSQPHDFSSHQDQAPGRKEYQYDQFNINTIYLRRDSQRDDFSSCPNCGHLITKRTRTLLRQDKDHVSSKSFVQASVSPCNLVRRTISSLFRPNYITALEKKVDLPSICDMCRKQVIMKYVVEQKWCVRPMMHTADSTSRRPAISSSYRNMIRDHYATCLPSSLELSSDTLKPDTESEQVIKNTDYSCKNKIEDDLKHELLKEYIKHKRKRKRYLVSYSDSSSSKCSSNEFGNFLFNDAKRKFKELHRKSKDKSRSTFDQACYTMNTTSSAVISSIMGNETQTAKTHERCDCACRCANHNCPNQKKDTATSNLELDKQLTSKEPVKICETHRIDYEGLKVVNPIPKEDSSMKSGLKLEINKSSKGLITQVTQKEPKVKHGTATELIDTITGQSGALNAPNNSNLQDNTTSPSHKHSKYTVPSEGSLRKLVTKSIAESYSSREGITNQNVMVINNPSCIVVKGGYLHLSQETAIGPSRPKTQAQVKDMSSNEENTARRKCDLSLCGCKKHSSTKNQMRSAPAVTFLSESTVSKRDRRSQTEYKGTVKTYKLDQIMQSVIVDTHDRYNQHLLGQYQYQSRQQSDKLIQSVCTHDPPCEVVPSCFKVKYKPDLLNYCAHVPLCARVPMCSLREEERLRFERMYSKQFISQLDGNAGTQVLMARMPCMAKQTPRMVSQMPRLAVQMHCMAVQTPGMAVQTPGMAVQTPGMAVQTPSMAVQTPCMAIQTPRMAVQTPCTGVETLRMAVHMHCISVQTCNTQRAWISNHDQAPVDQLPASATHSSCAHAVSNITFNGSLLSEKVPFTQNLKPKASFVSPCPKRFMKIFSRHKKS